jgi:hypothetical protein
LFSMCTYTPARSTVWQHPRFLTQLGRHNCFRSSIPLKTHRTQAYGQSSQPPEPPRICSQAGVSHSVCASFSEMDGGAYGRSFLSLPMEGLSSHSKGRRTNDWLLNVPLASLKPLVNEEASFDVSCGRHARPPYPLTWISSHIQLDFIY